MARFVWRYIEVPFRHFLAGWLHWLKRNDVDGPNCVDCGFIGDLKWGLCERCREEENDVW